MPTTRGRNQVAQPSGTIPLRAKGKLYLAPSAASRMSIGSVIVAPMPTAGPFTAAITGLREAKIRIVTTPPESRGSVSVSTRAD